MEPLPGIITKKMVVLPTIVSSGAVGNQQRKGEGRENGVSVLRVLPEFESWSAW